MTINKAEFEQFERYVFDTKKKRELECRPYLTDAFGLLARKELRSAVVWHEIRSYVGDADLVLCADVVTDSGDIEKFAFFWELKAPQCYLFEFDSNKNRCGPTADFVKAENQLLHYVHEAARNENIRIRLGLMSSSNILPGGIIIGTKNSILRGAKNTSDVNKAKDALKLRCDMLYKSHGIRVILWDRILDEIRPTSII